MIFVLRALKSSLQHKANTIFQVPQRSFLFTAQLYNISYQNFVTNSGLSHRKSVKI